MPTIVIRHPDGNEQAHELTDELTIGRAEGNDVVLTEGGVSRKHVRFAVDGDEVSVEDVGSANGTWVDGERIEEPTVISPGQTVTIGDYEVVVQAKAKKAAGKGKGKGAPAGPKPTKVLPAQGRRPSSPGRKKPQAEEVDGPQLRGLTPPVEGECFRIDGAMIVGRLASSSIAIDDDSVSRRHAEVSLTGRGVVVRDLGSANGTSVNGEPIADEVELAIGDVVTFGDIELIFEGEAVDQPLTKRGGREAPVARGGRAGPPVRGGKTGSGGRPSAAPAPNRKRLLLIAAVVVGLLVLAGIAKAVIGKPTPAKKPPVKVVEKSDDEKFQESLEQCRDLVSRQDPDFDEAERVCSVAHKLDPAQAEIRRLMASIESGRKCKASFDDAMSAKRDNRMEDAVAACEKVPRECSLFGRAYEACRGPMEDVLRETANECKRFFEVKQFESAHARCALYAKYKCQLMNDDEFKLPNALMKLKLDGPLGKNDWRPKDAAFVAFFKTRQKLKLDATPWDCPKIDVLRPPKLAEDPAIALKREFASWFPDPGFAQALQFYFDGKLDDAEVPLRKLKDNVRRAEFVEPAKRMSQTISAIKNHYQQGSALLNQPGKLDQAAKEFRDALELDEKLLDRGLDKLLESQRVAERERRTSFVRRDIQQTMAKHAYDEGAKVRTSSQVRACFYWKLGRTFTRSSPELQKALDNECTAEASQRYKALGEPDCASLKDVLDYAVPGDGIFEQVSDRWKELSCH